MDALFAGVDALEQAVDLVTAPIPQQLEVKDIITRIRQAGEQASQTFTAEFAIPRKRRASLQLPCRSRRATSASTRGVSTR